MRTISALLCTAAISLAMAPSALAWGTFHHSGHDHSYNQGSGSGSWHGGSGSGSTNDGSSISYNGGSGSGPWHDGNGSTNDGSSFAVPGPTAGVGLSAVVLAGGYFWFARRRAKSRKQPK